ncbi:HNH endonuclease [Aliiroseovarius lamellibrachiae]|uniref:HNH endonuclease n=1 Tax=Aliiroseovarius lamellibrachiae TaxID=1924933 RepID=UPI001BE0EC16|nr:HNH endonuclease [Aliiroseovarius lamellibrachiae]MBT2131206.1 HNH endonuclease [Aliiroseovarius lamellibrachiae]
MSATKNYTEEELSWVEACKDLPRRKIHEGFCAEFERTDITYQSIVNLCQYKGWLTRPGRKPIKFNADELTWLRDNASMRRGALHSSFCQTFNRSDLSARQLADACNHRGIRTGRGVYYQAYPLGSEYQCPRTGRIYIKVSLTAGKHENWVFKHRWLWEKTHGPIPKGYCLKCLSDNKADARPENWKLIPSGMRSYLNGPCGRDYDNAPPELKPMIMATAELVYKARRAKGGRT